MKPIHYASQIGNIEIGEIFFNNGINLNVIDKNLFIEY